MKHTPGPWKKDRRNGNFNKGIIDIRPLALNRRDLVDANRLVASINPKYSSGITSGEAEANALLITAAPDLLQWLEVAHDMLQQAQKSGGVTFSLGACKNVSDIRAVIDKAKGEAV